MHIVSLISDFGLQDYYVAELKARILSQNPSTQFVDVSHQIEPHDIVQAAHFLENVYAKFPESTIHVVAVNNYYDEDSKLICFSYQGHYFIGPDNGVFSLVFDDFESFTIYTIDEGEENNDQLERQIVSAINKIQKTDSIEGVGQLLPYPQIKMGIKPVITPSQIRATIIHIDHYGNVVINLKEDQFRQLRKGRGFEIFYSQFNPITEISSSYKNAGVGDVLCLFNSSGFLEISIYMGNASELLNLHRNETIQINLINSNSD